MAETTNPALTEIAFLEGNWAMTVSNASFMPDPADTMTGKASFQCREQGAFLVMYMGDPDAGAPDATWLISRDDANAEYKVLYYDNRQVSRVYKMSYSEGVWKMWRSSPDFSQRFSAELSEDRQTIRGQWEKSNNGKVWEHDFDVVYTRI